jgi:RHS repeat-associated protein
VISASCYTYSNGSSADTDLRQSVTNVSSTIPGCPSSGTTSTTTYTYDGLNRLTKAAASTVKQYLYDADGNMCAKYSGASAITLSGCTQTGTGITNYTFNAANQLTNSGYSFNNDGDQTAASGVFSTASYNKLGQMSSVTPTGGSAISMSYQGLGQALRVNNGSIGQISDQLGLEKDGTTTATYFTRDADGTILGEHRGSSSYYFLFDGNGSVTAVLDSTGSTTPTDSFSYDPYGATTSSGSLYEPIQYAGGYNDNAGSGEQLYKFGERYYDPTVGRWTTTDPLDQPLDLHGWNQYAYAGDDPTNFVDSTGMSLFGNIVNNYLGACAGGAITGGAVAALTGPQDILPGAAIGCAQGAAAEWVKRNVNETLGTGFEYLGRANEVKDIWRYVLSRRTTRYGVRYVRVRILIRVYR